MLKKDIDKKFFFKELPILIFLVLIAFLYLHNLSQDAYGGDVGDMVTAAFVAGVPHSPGYPLFTFLGFLLTRLPLLLSPAGKVGLISVVSSIIGLYFFYKIACHISKSILIALLSTSILAFSYLFWFYSEIAEVFAFNHLFIILLFYLALMFYEEKKRKYLYYFAFFAGLSLSHHHFITIIFPSLLILLSKHFKFILKKKVIIWMTTLFAIGLLPYIYIPIAASHNTVINWDNASTLKNFIRLVLRQDYGIGPNTFPLFGRYLVAKDYFLGLFSSITYAGIFICVLGIFYLYKKDKRLFISFIVAFFLTGPLFIAYQGSAPIDIFWSSVLERFYTASSIIALFFLPYGFLLIKKFFESRLSLKIYTILILLEFFIIPIYLLRYNFPKTDLSKTHIGDNLSYDILSPLPPRSLVYVAGDSAVFNSWYVHYVLGFRKDIMLAQPGGTGNEIFQNEQLKIFQKLHPGGKYEKKYADEIFLQIMKDRSIYSILPIGTTIKDLVWIPMGILYTPMYKSDIPDKEKYLKEVDALWSKFHIVPKEKLSLGEKSLTLSHISKSYASALVNTADFIYSQYDDSASAKQFYLKALEIDSDNARAYGGLGVTEFDSSNNCSDSLNNLNKAIASNPVGKNYYVYLYIITRQCTNDKNQIKKIEDRYYSVFNEKIIEALKKIVKENKI